MHIKRYFQTSKKRQYSFKQWWLNTFELVNRGGLSGFKTMDVALLYRKLVGNMEQSDLNSFNLRKDTFKTRDLIVCIYPPCSLLLSALMTWLSDARLLSLLKSLQGCFSTHHILIISSLSVRVSLRESSTTSFRCLFPLKELNVVKKQWQFKFSTH